MGHSESKNYIQDQYDIVRLRQDGCAYLLNKKTKDQYLLRTVCSNIGEQIAGFQDLLRKRQQIKCPHLLDLVQIRSKQQKNVCSVVHKLYLLIEYPFKTLKDEIQEKSRNKISSIFFQENELWSILYSCCVALNILHNKKMPHESLTSDQVFISKDGLIKISDPILLGLDKNYIKILKNKSEYAHISPQIINFLDECNFSYYDKEKADVYILGAVMLEASLLREVHTFDLKTKKPCFDQILKHLTEVKSRYSFNYYQILQKMLQLHSKWRPNFQQLISTIEAINNFESSEQATQTLLSPAGSNTLSSHKSQKTLPKSTLNRNQHRQVPLRQNLANQGPNYTPNPNNLMVKNKGETIIRKLQSTEQVKNVQYSANQTSNWTKPIASHRFPHLMAGQTNINHPNINNAQPPSARVEQFQDRFSYNKFGNIQLTQMPARVRPLFSHEIPQINQILRSQNNTNKNHLNQVPSMQVQQPRHLAHQSSVPVYAPQVSFMKPLHEDDMRGVGVLGHPVHHHDNNLQTNSECTILQNANKPTLPHNLQKQASKLASKVQQLPKHRSEAIIPELNFYKNPELKQPNETYTAQKKINAVPKLMALKENEVSQNQIFAVTEKTQQNLQTSPAKGKISLVKIKQPQKSPGSESNQSSRVKSSSNQKITSQSNDNDDAKFVVLILEGGGRYQGYEKNGMKTGEGRLQFSDGGYYVGQWKDNQMHGYGKLHYENGQVAYQGKWENDQFCGHGRVFNDRPEKLTQPFNYHDFANLGEKWIYYEGEFKNDSKHGKGKLRLTNGEVFQGNFVFDSIQGEGIFYTSKREAFRGFWKDNMLVQN